MKIRHFTMAVAASIGVAGCFGETNDRVITVEGHGQASALPDQFTMDFSILSQGTTRVEALEDAAARLEAIRDGLPELEGLTALTLENSTAEVEATYSNSECARYGSEVSGCLITGYRVTIEGGLIASPPTEAGNALSLVSELGATSAHLGRFSVSDPEAIRSQAQADAARSARAQADEISRSLGMRVAGVRAIRGPDRNVFAAVTDLADRDDIVVVTGSRIATVPLELAIAPIEFEAELTVQFDLVGDPPSDRTD